MASHTPPRVPPREIIVVRQKSNFLVGCLVWLILVPVVSFAFLVLLNLFLGSRYQPVPSGQGTEATVPEHFTAELLDSPNAEATQIQHPMAGSRWSYLRHEDERLGYFEFRADGTVAHNDGHNDYPGTWRPDGTDGKSVITKESTFRVSDEDPNKAVQTFRNFHRVLYRGSTLPPPESAKAKALVQGSWEMNGTDGKSTYSFRADGTFFERWNATTKGPGKWKPLYGEVFLIEYPVGEKYAVSVGTDAAFFVRTDAATWQHNEKLVLPDSAFAPLPSYEKFTFDQLVAATRERFRDRRWKEHQERLVSLALGILHRRKLTADPLVLAEEFRQKTLPYALVQVAFMRRLGLDDLDKLATDDFAATGAVELFTSLPLLEKFYNALDPADYAFNAVHIWAMLTQEAIPEERAAFENLVLALALIHDAPNAASRKAQTHGDIDAATKALAYYKEKQKKRALYLKCDEVLPDELVWSVAPSAFPLEEYEWALKPHHWRIVAPEGMKFRSAEVRTQSGKLLQDFLRINNNYERVAGAYGVIRYEANKNYPKYTMNNILCLGGTCSNQADFSVGFARSHGVPAGRVSGEEPSGINHEWCIFRSEKGWRTTGRQNSDIGTSRNPQTNGAVAETSFYLYNDPDRKNGKREVALRLVRAAQLLAQANDWDGQIKLLDAAVRRSPAQLVFWEEWLLALAASEENFPLTQTAPIVRRYREQFKHFPDFYFRVAIQEFETRHLISQWSDAQVSFHMRERRQQMIKEHPARFDLVLASLKYETKQLAKLKRYGQIKILLDGAVDDYGKKSLRDYDRIFQAMLEIVREGNDFPASRELFVRLMWIFEKHHYKGRRDTHQLNLSTLNLDLRRMNREKAVFEKLEVELERLGADSSRLHAANRVKELETGIAEVKTIIGKIKRKMTPNGAKSVPNATDDDA